jgi:hypothetical protein
VLCRHVSTLATHVCSLSTLHGADGESVLHTALTKCVQQSTCLYLVALCRVWFVLHWVALCRVWFVLHLATARLLWSLHAASSSETALCRVWFVLHLATARLLWSLIVASSPETALCQAATSCTGSRHAVRVWTHGVLLACRCDVVVAAAACLRV